MTNKSTLLKIRKIEKFQYLSNHWRKKLHAKTFYFKKIRGITKKKFQTDQREKWHWSLKVPMNNVKVQ